MYEYRVIHSDAAEDIAILEVVKLFKATGQPLCTTFPVLSSQIPQRGMSVGYLTTFWKPSPDGLRTPLEYFGAAHVSYMGYDVSGNRRWVLTGEFAESGFSGSPVFRPNGELISIITGVVSYSAILGGQAGLPVNFPMTTIYISIPAPIRAQADPSPDRCCERSITYNLCATSLPKGVTRGGGHELEAT